MSRRDWTAEQRADIEAFFDKLGDRVPAELRSELAALRQRLDA